MLDRTKEESQEGIEIETLRLRLRDRLKAARENIKTRSVRSELELTHKEFVPKPDDHLRQQLLEVVVGGMGAKALLEPNPTAEDLLAILLWWDLAPPKPRQV